MPGTVNTRAPGSVAGTQSVKSGSTQGSTDGKKSAYRKSRELRKNLKKQGGKGSDSKGGGKGDNVDRLRNPRPAPGDTDSMYTPHMYNPRPPRRTGPIDPSTLPEDYVCNKCGKGAHEEGGHHVYDCDKKSTYYHGPSTSC